MAIDFVGFAYAACVAAGGIAGYAKAGSIPSLGAGLLFGGVLSYGAFQASQAPSSHAVMLGASTFLTGMMGMRYYNSGKFMPAGFVALLSLTMMLRYSARGLGILESNAARPVAQ
ncbi:transmembrane protein 14C isoform X2 [Thrips palmi]|uniref:Transmembrane protein 14C isoform X2 n=1 Tax=Thrips palmi TaxID=161013 RepID=A0A6P8ZCY5_THRPL|nr:transmembrane protein 14C isoform X2 [Thrips palmi]